MPRLRSLRLRRCDAFTLTLVTLVVSSSCFRFRSVGVENVSPNVPVVVESAVKAHLIDGRTAVYEDGVIVGRDSLRGTGRVWNVALSEAQAIETVPLDSVIALETFKTKTNWAASIATPVLVTGLAVGIACAVDPKCFGSCPTFYSDSSGTPILEAEGFSYAIAPVFETRDVDRLRVQPNASGRVRLEVRNEALETHYLNHLELLEAWHEPDEFIVPESDGTPIAVRNLAPLGLVVDGASRNVTSSLAAHDGVAFESDPGLLAAAGPNKFYDHLDFEIAVPPESDSVAIVLRLRNSLLSTVMFYDLMLGDRGPKALDWLGHELDRFVTAAQLGMWTVNHLGMRFQVPEDAGWRTISRFGDSGPIAWKDLAVTIPVTERPRQRVRLSFVIDHWRIDRIAYTAAWRRPEKRIIPLAAVKSENGLNSLEATARLMEADSSYLTTSMGQWFEAWFEPGPAEADHSRTFLLASQGYYIEWVRREWLQRRPEPVATSGSGPIVESLRRWRDAQEEMETTFYSTRVPVR